MPRRMPGVVYPDPVPTPGGPPPEADPNDERTMALRFVRTAFDPPLPDPFADWLMHLHFLVREGSSADKLVLIPRAVQALEYTFDHTVLLYGEPALRLDDSLHLFGRHDLLEDAPALPDPLKGFTSLAAALVVHQVRATLTLRRNEQRGTLDLDGQQAQILADALIPAEGSLEDEFGLALELLNRFVDGPKPTPCSFDHHGHCQEHHDDFADQTRFAQQEGYALLVRHGLREETS